MATYKHFDCEEFNNLKEFTHACNDRELNKVWSGTNTRDLSSRTRDARFTGSKSYEEAEELLLYGWDKYTEEIKKAMFEVDKVDTTESLMKTSIDYSYVGQVPCVPRALIGLPDSMILYHKPPTKQRTICIVYDICAVWDVSAGDLTKAGITILTAVYHLEKLGFKVRLDIAQAACGGNQILGWRLNAKDYKQPTDITKLAFPIIHPSMLRRMSFAWLERSPAIRNSDFRWGYGSVLYRMGKDAIKQYERSVLRKDEHLIFYYDVARAGFDPIKLLRNKKIFYGNEA